MSTQTLEENELLVKDSKYRIYVSAVDKALKNFEYTTEWADLIAALGKLNKVLLSYTKYPVIPRRIKLSKRLAQCMHPALPAGVHLKALETYDVIFKCMGTNRLAQELFIYSAGLFPLLGYAATPVRPALLAVYEAHFVPLGERLLPALSGFLTGVLPGLEPGSDHYDSTNGLLERVCESVGVAHFYGALWKCIQCDSPARAPAISFALTHINRHETHNDNLELMLNAIEAALQDTSVLVQRSALDLLIIVLPLHGESLPSTSLVSAALHTVLRRDMSLNRRLYSWLLGTETTHLLTSTIAQDITFKVEDEVKLCETNNLNSYYKKYSHSIVLRALETIFQQSYQQFTQSPSTQSASQLTDIRPYRILTSLLDKPEIATDILDTILFDVFRALYLTCKHHLASTSSSRGDSTNGGSNDESTLLLSIDFKQNQSKKLIRRNLLLQHCQELIKQANLLFNTLETYYIWHFIGDLFQTTILNQQTSSENINESLRNQKIIEDVAEVGSGAPTILELCSITELLLDIMPIETYINSSSEILPNLFTRIITLSNDNLDAMETVNLVHTLNLCMNILTKIQPITPTLAASSTTIRTNISQSNQITNAQQPDNVSVLEKSKSSNDLSIDKSESEQLTDTSFISYDAKDHSLPTNFENHLKTAPLNLEKSKSDSKLNDTIEDDDTVVTVAIKNERERSNSNQMLRRFRSPKFEKKSGGAKNKKSKSNSKLFDLNRLDDPVEEIIKAPIYIAPASTPSSTAIKMSEIENKHILKCLNLYKLFYTNLLQHKIFKKIHLLDYYEKFLIKISLANENFKNLEILLNDEERYKDRQRMCNLPQITYNIEQLTNEFCICNYNRNDCYCNAAVQIASTMFLEFSAFPNLLDATELFVSNNNLPLWFKYLAVIGCMQYNGSRDLQLVGMNTFLEIISLSKTFNQINTNNEKINSSILMGILPVQCVNFIEHSTAIIEVMAQTLWNYLNKITDHQQIMTCISLLYHLHNIFDNSNLVENVIGRYLVTHNNNYTFPLSSPSVSSSLSSLNALKCFATLWHVGRDLEPKFILHKQTIRHFEKCLLKILDNLQNTDYVTHKLFAENFILHCLLRNDVSRLITPLFIMLLAPNTARISVLHANIEKSNMSNNMGENSSSADGDHNNGNCTNLNGINAMHIKRDNEDRSLKKIYAISSVDGHVMYHIADDKKHRIPIANRLSNEIVNLTTSLIDNKSIITEKNHNFQVDEPTNSSNTTSSHNNMKVFVNPLSLKDSDKESSSIDSYSSDSTTPEIDTDEKNSLLNNSEIIDLLNDDDFELSNQSSCISPQREDENDTINTTTENNEKIAANESSLIANFSPKKYLEKMENISEGDKVIQEEISAYISTKSYLIENVSDVAPSISTSAPVATAPGSGKRVFVKSHSLDEHKKNENDDDDENLTHSWSYQDNDLEISTPAVDFFQNNKVVEEENIVSDMIAEVPKNEQKKIGKSILKNRNSSLKYPESITINSVHSHLLLYRDVYDSNITLYAIRTLKSILNTNPKLLIGSLSTTAVQTNSDLINLLARHRKSVYGYGFYGDSNEYINLFRGNMYLEVLISICLNYSRSFYPNLSTNKLSSYEVNNNLKIQLECLDLLHIIIKELIGIVKESGKGFACYIADLLLKCKIQKVVLHSLVASVRSCDMERSGGCSFTDEILVFNNLIYRKNCYPISENVESFQTQVLRLVQSLIALEYHVEIRGECSNIASIPQQATFRAALLSALQSSALRPLHRTWTGMIAASLPYLGSSLTQIVLSVIHQLCSNIEITSKEYVLTGGGTESIKSVREAHRKTFKPDLMALISTRNLSSDFNLTPIDDCTDNPISMNRIRKSQSTQSQPETPLDESSFDIIADYAITQLESLTILTQYCLLENTQQNVLTQSTNTSSSSTSSGIPFAALSNPSHLINNLLNVFLSNPLAEENTKSQQSENYQESKRAVLSHLPRIVTSVALLWQQVAQAALSGSSASSSSNNNTINSDIASCDTNYNSMMGCSLLGNRRIIRKQLLELLSPISLHHSTHFIAAIGVAWNERKPNIIKTVLPSPNDAQKSLVDLISAIRVIPIDNLVQTIHSVLKTPPITEGLKSDVSLDVSVLELFYCYIQNISNTQLLESWSSLLSLIKDGPTFSPSCQFIILAILNEFVQKCCPLTEKKDQKDLQDVTTKIIESISQISGSCLEQTTWLRKNLAVREDDSTNNTPTTPEISNVHNYSVQAQTILAEILAPLLDVCFGSQEKDKVVNIISSLMNNVVPYLRKHSARNVSNWTACSSLLASLSGYPATRRAWRREALEILLDPALFKMPAECIAHWRNIVDHLMTHDNTTFRELMNRIALSPSGGLSLFSSRDQEAEQRAMLLKRLAFVILCGDTDQYSKQMPEIQEQLAGGFRMGASNVAGSVFLCCRALILRLTSLHMNSLWPLILSECLQTLLRVENQLSGNTELNSTTIDGSWGTDCLSPEGLKRTLGAVQLLDLSLLMPTFTLPHFQMYKWAFISCNELQPTALNTATAAANNVPQTNLKSVFQPHLNRILELLDAKYGACDNILQPHSSGLYIFSSLEGTITVNDLHCLLKALVTRKYQQKTITITELITAVELDFLERIPLI